MTNVQKGCIWMHAITLINAEVILKQGNKLNKAYDISKDNIDRVNVLTDELHTRVQMDEPETAFLTRESRAKALIDGLLALRELTEKQVDCKNDSTVKSSINVIK